MITFSENSSVQFAKPTIHFNGGEVHPTLEIKQPHSKAPVEIFALIKTATDFMELAMVKDAVDRLIKGKVPVHVHLPYIPYARQDRVANKGEALGIKVFANLLNQLGFDSVRVNDAHSIVSLALIDNVEEITQLDGMAFTFGFGSNDIILAPDAGALKKAGVVAEKYGLPLLIATKVRNTATGKLSEPKLQFTDEITLDWLSTQVRLGGRIIVVDDICDAGGTFIQLGKLLADLGITKSHTDGYGEDSVTSFRGATLLVTHGIFANNAVARLTRYFDKIQSVYDWTK